MEQVFEVGQAFFNFKIYKFYIWNEYFKFGINILNLKCILQVQNEYLKFSGQYSLKIFIIYLHLSFIVDWIGWFP